MTLPLLEGIDGVHKMSKSLGNAVGIAEPAAEIYGKIMSISDDLMIRYYELLSDVPDGEARLATSDGNLHPMDAKKALAAEIVARYHGTQAAEVAAEEFARRFQRGGLPDEVPEYVHPNDGWPVALCRLLKAADLAKSMSEARRLIAQGGVRIDGERVTDPEFTLSSSDSVLIQVGKRRIVRVRFRD